MKGPDWATGKPVYIAKPEEQVRQDYERALHHDYGYPKATLDIEVTIQRGSTRREKADIVIYETADDHRRDQSRDILGIIETKRPDRKDGVKQLASYLTATSAVWGVWTNGEEIEFLLRDPSSGQVQRDVIFEIPAYGASIESVGTHTYDDLVPATNLKLIFRRLLNELYTNTNISRREKLGNEMTKLLFCKLQDEQATRPAAIPAFRVGIGDHTTGFEAVAERINALFSLVKDELVDDGVFSTHDEIILEYKSIAYVVGELQRYSLLQTDEDVVGSAFEVFAESKFAGEKGEFFTPRAVVHTAIKLIDPKPGERIIDPACGSGGFLICALQHIWRTMDEASPWSRLSETNRTELKRRIAKETIYGLDKESDLVRIAKAYMAIIGDGKSQIAQANSLHAPADFEGAARDLVVTDDQFEAFDVVLTNPPFGSKKTKVAVVDSAQFDLGHKWGKVKDNSEYTKKNEARKTPPQELFIERCFQMLKPGGRMAIVLPETIGHAPTKKYIVQYIRKHGSIRAVVDLPHNTFRPHCNAKTLLWIIDKTGPSRDVTFAVAEEMGSDHEGKIKYRMDDGRITDQVWDDTVPIREELSDAANPENRYVFQVPHDQIANDIYVPRYYWQSIDREIKAEAENAGLDLVPLGQLVDDGIVQCFHGHGAPANQYKGTGPVPYVRVGDIGNWLLYKNPTARIPEWVYESQLGANGVRLEPGDLVFVKDGSYRIGDIGVVLPGDTKMLLDGHCRVFRVVKENEWGIDWRYLAYLMSHRLTRRQIPSKVFINTTLPDIGNRWRDLLLPISTDESIRARVRMAVGRVCRQRAEANSLIEEMLIG